MKFTINNVKVTNWSKNPLLKMGTTSRAQLATAVLYSKQMVDDAVNLLREYRRYRQVQSVDATMANDLLHGSNILNVEDALQRYFGLNPAAAGDHVLATIITNFQSIQTGFAAGFDLVVGYVCDGDDISEGIRDAATSVSHGRFRGAASDIKFIGTGTRGWVSAGNKRRIHLNKSMIKSDSPGRIARTIVHEASHKFANTADIAYKHQNLKNNAGGHANLTNNADSYAWCARRIWKKKRHMPVGS